MRRHSIDRWTDTTTFGIVLIFSAVLLLPVLALGLVVSFVMLVVAVAEQTAELAGAVVVVLSAGGAVGMFGWLRAHHQVKRPTMHNVTATLLCLAVGIATALAVGAIVMVPTVEAALRSPWGSPAAAWPGVLFVAAHAVWALSGIAWVQRLSLRYAEHTGRPFDGIPIIVLLVAIALATAAALIATAL